MSKYQFETETVHKNYCKDDTNAILLPLHLSTAYHFDDADHGADLFDLKVAGNIYSRLTNPTVDAFASAVNSLEGGVGALAFASGSAAIAFAIMAICKAGDHIIASKSLYGGTAALFAQTLPRLGITTTFIDQNADINSISALIRSNTKLIFGETIGNPLNEVLDFEKFSSIAKKHIIPFMVDNTYASPYLLRPLEHGADIVVHSATKYIGGHGNAMGGVVVDGGTFDFTNEKYPEFHTPSIAYHGLVYTDTFKEAAYIYKLRTEQLRDFGASLSPFNAYLLNTGLETLHLRMDRNSTNALELANWLEGHTSIEWVSYPLLKSNPHYERALKYFPRGAGGMLSFGLKGDLEQSKKFLNALELIIRASNLGDVRTIASHPASTTHRQLSSEALAAASITPSLIRLSVGIEAIVDLKSDIEQALNKSII